VIFHDFSRSSRAAFLGLPRADKIAIYAQAGRERTWRGPWTKLADPGQ
jgi:hypothetical protein